MVAQEVAAGASPAVNTQLSLPRERYPPTEVAEIQFFNGLFGHTFKPIIVLASNGSR
ncbi:MAG: hypothetical protein IH988_10830 [Planctomycetes bacterium]|nr:hypothetical protein [Planctomycetota bacterium]